MIARALIRSSVGRGRLDAMHITVGGRGRTSAGPIKESAGLLGRVDLNEWDVPEMGLTFPSFHSRSQNTCHCITKASGISSCC